jgi:hypothetical protein
MCCRYDGSYTMHAYGSESAYVDNFLVEENICYNKGPFLIGGGRPSKNIRVFKNFLYGVDMRIGYNAPYNENCEICNNVIVNGDLNINLYKTIVKEGNLVIKRGQERPNGIKTVLLPNRFNENRAHLVICDWQKNELVKIAVKPFLKKGDTFKLFDPQNASGVPVAEGRCSKDTIKVPVKSEFAVFVLKRYN